MPIRESIKVDVRVENANKLSGLQSSLTKSMQEANKLAQSEYRTRQATAKIAEQEVKRQRELEQGQYRLHQAARKIAVQQEQAEAKRAASVAKQTAREDALRVRQEAAEAKRHARAEALAAKQLNHEQALRTRQVQLIERNAQRAAVAAERQADREKRALITVESEMVRLQHMHDRRAATAEARSRLGMKPVGRDGDFFRGHGFTNRSRQILGVARDLSVAGWGAYGLARMGVGMAESVINPYRELESSAVQARLKGDNYSRDDQAMIMRSARQIGRTTTTSATDAGRIAVELAAAGVSAAGQPIGMRTAAQLAQSGDMSAEQASMVMVQTKAQFGLQESDFGNIGDTLVKAANLSSVSVAQLAEALDKVGPLAKEVNMPLAETAGTLSYLGEMGIKGSEAGTGLRTMLASLAKPAKQAKNALATLGLSKEDLQKGMSDLPAFMAQLQAAMAKKKLTQGQRLEILTGLFGREGLTVATNLLNGADAWKKFRDSTRDANGEMERAANEGAQTLDGRMKILNNTMEEAKLQVAERFAPALTNTLVPGLTKATLAMGDYLNKVSGMELATDATGAAIGTGFAVWGARTIPGVLGAGFTAAIKSESVTAALGAGGKSIAGTLMGVVGVGIAGYELGTYLGKAIAGAKTDEEFMAALNDLIGNGRKDVASGRGLPPVKSKPTTDAALAGDYGPLSPAEIDKRRNEDKKTGVVDINGAIRIDLKYGKPPRIEEFNVSGPIPLRVGVQGP